ncbi:STAS domain-containing protein [Limimaricola soesokkakensis]|uniref:STAS domain-containing protein n=1 Tax=Limimaricola soesokkakensis TaxID=1343159 RepID=UPI003513FDC5
MKIEERYEHGICVLSVGESRLDASQAPALKDALVQRVEAGQHQLVLDLSQTAFMDSSGLGALVSCLKRLGPRGNMAVVGVSGAVQRLFTLTRMDRVFILESNIDAAVARLRG